MSEEKLLTIREASLMLGISEKEVMDLAESGAIPAYKIAGVYLRFKKDQVLQYRRNVHYPSIRSETLKDYPIKDRISDFFYVNDFYILSALIVCFLLTIIFFGY